MTVAKVDRSNFKKEQSVYMPVIPAIAKCPEHLLPSKEWEDAFLDDFSKLRQVFTSTLINVLKEKAHECLFLSFSLFHASEYYIFLAFNFLLCFIFYFVSV